AAAAEGKAATPTETKEAPKGMPTGGAAIMREGPNLGLNMRSIPYDL
nr:photosystem I chain II precursor - spinach [Spinacia oleracea]